MEEYKSNSHKSREEQPQGTVLPAKKVEKVISGAAKPKKKGEIQKLADIFIPTDIASLKSYVIHDVVIPYIKKTISETVDAILFGGDSPKKKTSASKVSYGSYYNKSSDIKRDVDRQNRSVFDYDNIIFENRGDAEAVLDAMIDIIDTYSVVSVGDLYDLADITTDNFNIHKYGWSDLSSAQVIRVRGDGYSIKLPRALPIN
jgi:hypothetical protein